MTPVEEIQAAIDKLTELRNLSNEGGNPKTWSRKPLSPLLQADVVDSAGDIVAERCYGPDAALIVTLHRTIDTQLALLTIGKRIMEHFSTGNGCPLDEHRAILALAKSINGKDTK